MTPSQTPPPEPTPVEDVRRVREEIAAQHHGDLAAHRRETLRIFESVRGKLNLKVVTPSPLKTRQEKTG